MRALLARGVELSAHRAELISQCTRALLHGRGNRRVRVRLAHRAHVELVTEGAHTALQLRCLARALKLAIAEPHVGAAELGREHTLSRGALLQEGPAPLGPAEHGRCHCRCLCDLRGWPRAWRRRRRRGSKGAIGQHRPDGEGGSEGAAEQLIGGTRHARRSTKRSARAGGVIGRGRAGVSRTAADACGAADAWLGGGTRRAVQAARASERSLLQSPRVRARRWRPRDGERAHQQRLAARALRGRCLPQTTTTTTRPVDSRPLRS
mmetsp:Transcript_16350/g.42362  ORF Transcript_16350/g.42362 Transcript_16350/m.42362 type:complete len:265 (+) Transcript_16350:628-1422(+)